MSADPAYYSSLGLLVEVRGADGATRARLDDLYSECRLEPDRTADLELVIAFDELAGGYELRADGSPCANCADRVSLLDWVAWKINSTAVEQHRTELVVHAAAVARAGHAAMIIGPSGAGKSTLAAALTLGGAAYMGDDSLIVDSAGRVRSNPKPLSIDDAARDALLGLVPDEGARRDALRTVRHLAAPRCLGAAVAVDERATPVVVVHSAFHPGAPTSVRDLAPAEVAALLADQSFNFPTVGPAGLHAVAALARRARGIAIEFGDLLSATGLIADAFAEAIAGRAPVVDDPVAPVRPGLAVEVVSGEALIWDTRTRELHHLSASATAIWRACEESTDPEMVTAAVAAATPAPPLDLRAEVTRCIAELDRLGVLGTRRGQDSMER